MVIKNKIVNKRMGVEINFGFMEGALRILNTKPHLKHP